MINYAKLSKSIKKKSCESKNIKTNILFAAVCRKMQKYKLGSVKYRENAGKTLKSTRKAQDLQVSVNL